MRAHTILIIDDEQKLRGLLARIIQLEGFVVVEAGNIKDGLKLLEKENIDVILCDVRLPDGNGIDFVLRARIICPMAEIILLTAYGNIPDGIQAMKNGAFDYITKGDDNAKVIPLIGKALEKIGLQKRIIQLESQVGRKYSFDSIIGNSKSIKAVIGLALKVSVTNTTVLLLGETGTGKEVFAQAIHAAGSRVNKPFLALNCSAFSRELLESEIFGHKAGAFTGAVKDKKGLIEEANGGTLFLDEIGEMPLDLQSKLLRVLETSAFIKVGDVKSTAVDVRFIAATNRKMEQEVKDGKFREDLFYRLNVFTIELPPLRDRKEDIPLLVHHYISFFALKTNKRIKGISKQAESILIRHNWRGNVRELKNVIERSVILEDGELITENSLPYDMHFPARDYENTYDLASIEQQHIKKVLLHTLGNKAEAARLLNIGLTTLYRKIEEYEG